MDAFERGLRRGIPLEKAASFFVGLKRDRQLPPEDDAIMAEAVKQASALVSEVPASERFRLLAEHIKKTAKADDGGGKLPSPKSHEVPDVEAFLTAEREGMAAETANALAFYQQKLQELREEANASTESATQLQQQVEQLTAAQESHAGALAAAQQEGQIAQQAAMQQVQAANQSATQAMQQAVDAENRALEAKGQEAAAKIQSQQVRSQLFDLASQGLPGTEPELGGAGSPTEGLAPTQEPAAGAAGGAQGGEQGPETEAGGEAPAAGLNQEGESAAAEGMPGQEAAPEGAGAALSPDAAPAPGDSSAGAGGGSGQPPQANSTGEASAPEQDPSAKRTGQVSIKVGADIRKRYEAMLARRAPPEGRAAEEAKIAAALPEYLRRPEIISALAGGALGAGAAGLEASGHGPDLEKLRGRVAEGEAAAKEPGLRGFAKAFDVAKDKALLTLGEATQNHPVAATITGGLVGAGVGHQTGPRLASLLREAAAQHKTAP